jgi:hypothetical protein
MCLSVKLTNVCSDAEDPGLSRDASSAISCAAMGDASVAMSCAGITKPLVPATQVSHATDANVAGAAIHPTDKIDFHQVHRHPIVELPPSCGEVYIYVALFRMY